MAKTSFEFGLEIHSQNLAVLRGKSANYWPSEHVALARGQSWSALHTDRKENKIFLIYKEIQMGSGAKSYMRKGFLIYEEMRKHFTYMGTHWGGL
jgi:hypothetical protein